MDIDLLYPGAYPLARARMAKGEQLTAESGAMVAMSPGMELSSEAKGGILKSLGRKMLTGESFFQSTITATQDGEVLLAPSTPGDLIVLDGTHDTFVQKGAFVASGENVEIATKGQGLGKGIFGGEGIFVLKATGTGPLVLSSFGAVHKLELEAGEEHIVDNGHLVAWTCAYNVEKAAKGWMGSIASGEGLVCRFTGPGTVHIQTRNLGPFAALLAPFFPRQTS